MKAVILSLFLTLAIAQAHAQSELSCISSETGEDAGKLTVVHEKLIYSNQSTSNEGWELKVADGKLLNADLMVRNGIPFQVGSIVNNHDGLLLTIRGQQLECR